MILVPLVYSFDSVLSSQVAKKKTTAQGRIAQSLGIKKPSRSSSIPSVYRPCEQTLGSMRADIGAASLSIYGDPFDLDPFDSGWVYDVTFK